MKNERLFLFSLIAIACLAWLVLRESLLSAHDPANFVLAIQYGLNLFAERPHAPGYPAFVVIWRALAALGLSAHTAILFVNLLFTIIGVVATYFLAKFWYGKRSARLAALTVLLNPLTLYFLSVAEIYSFDLAFSALAGLALSRVPAGTLAYVWLAAGALGCFRLSSTILLLPLFFFVSYRREGLVACAKGCAAFAFGQILWLIPVSLYYGSATTPFAVLSSAGHLQGTLAQTISTFIAWLVWCVNAGWIALTRLSRLKQPTFAWQIMLVWIVPASLFFMFWFYAKGYLLLLLPAIAVLTAHALSESRLRYAMPMTGCLMFLFIPFIAPSENSTSSHSVRTISERVESAVLRGFSFYAPSVAHIRESDIDIRTAVELIHSAVDSGGTVIVDPSAGLWAYPRSLQVHMPNYRFLMPVVTDSTSVHVFERDTVLREVAVYPYLSAAHVYFLADARLALSQQSHLSILREERRLVLAEISPIDRSRFWSWNSHRLTRPSN